jgi:hypothetical protein
MIDELSRRGFVRLLGAAMTVPTLGALGLKPDSPLVVAHTLDNLDVPTGTTPMLVEPVTLTQFDDWAGGKLSAVQLDGISISAQRSIRWVASPECPISVKEGETVALEFSLRGGLLRTAVTRRAS